MFNWRLHGADGADETPPRQPLQSTFTTVFAAILLVLYAPRVRAQRTEFEIEQDKERLTLYSGIAFFLLSLIITITFLVARARHECIVRRTRVEHDKLQRKSTSQTQEQVARALRTEDFEDKIGAIDKVMNEVSVVTEKQRRRPDPESMRINTRDAPFDNMKQHLMTSSSLSHSGASSPISPTGSTRGSVRAPPVLAPALQFLDGVSAQLPKNNILEDVPSMSYGSSKRRSTQKRNTVSTQPRKETLTRSPSDIDDDRNLTTTSKSKTLRRKQSSQNAASSSPPTRPRANESSYPQFAPPEPGLPSTGERRPSSSPTQINAPAMFNSGRRPTLTKGQFGPEVVEPPADQKWSLSKYPVPEPVSPITKSSPSSTTKFGTPMGSPVGQSLLARNRSSDTPVSLPNNSDPDSKYSTISTRIDYAPRQPALQQLDEEWDGFERVAQQYANDLGLTDGLAMQEIELQHTAPMASTHDRMAPLAPLAGFVGLQQQQPQQYSGYAGILPQQTGYSAASSVPQQHSGSSSVPQQHTGCSSVTRQNTGYSSALPQQTGYSQQAYSMPSKRSGYLASSPQPFQPGFEYIAQQGTGFSVQSQQEHDAENGFSVIRAQNTGGYSQPPSDMIPQQDTGLTAELQPIPQQNTAELVRTAMPQDALRRISAARVAQHDTGRLTMGRYMPGRAMPDQYDL